jgi:prepilin-type processing-associated H-X9-DG protein
MADPGVQTSRMTVDLSGGLDPAREYFLIDQPHPDVRDSASFWAYDDGGFIGLPRIGIEAVGSKWAEHQYQVNVAFADGRVFRIRESGPRHPPIGLDGTANVLGAGPLEIRCIRPFEASTASFDGTALRTSTEALLRGDRDGQSARLEFHLEASMVAPPWVNGSMSEDAASRMQSSIEGGFMGGDRFEQLFRATGYVRVDGEEHPFSGTGTRVRRQGPRDMAGFWGHCQQSATFPSGRGFGYIAYRPRPDGTGAYNEGYVFTGDGRLVPARVIRAPWLSAPPRIGEDVSLILESDLGPVEVAGSTTVSVFNLGDPRSDNALAALHQAGVRYRWGDEVAAGALERSTPPREIPALANRAH